MPNPEIARRCRACGASVRAGAQSCPQCGQAVIKSTVSVHSMADSREPPGHPKANVEDSARRTSAVPEQKIEPPSAVANPAASANGLLAPDPVPSRATIRDERATRRPQHAATVDNSSLPRVEKLRQASIDMLDEAADDPSLRFVLISVTLFLCFLLILLASTIFK